MGVCVTLTLRPQAFNQKLPLLSQSSCSMLSATLSYRPHIRSSRFAVSAVLSSTSQVKQSAKSVEASRNGNLVPLHRCIFADHLTPVLAYRCLVNENDHVTPSFLFESVESGIESSTIGRYSIVGANPAMEIIAKKSSVIVMNHLEGWRTEERVEDPIMVPRRITENWSPRQNDDLPPVFCGGWVGYFSHDTLQYAEKKLAFSSAAVDDGNLPDSYLGLYDDVLVFDNVEKKLYVIHWVQLDRFSSTEEALENGMDRLKSLLSKVFNIVNPRLSTGSIEQAALQRSNIQCHGVESDAYMNAIVTAKEHMMAGDLSHLALSKRFVRRTFSEPFEVYRSLSIVNPSPFMAYLQVRGSILVASSAKTFTYVQEKRKPINGFVGGIAKRVGMRLNDIVLGQELFDVQKHQNGHTLVADRPSNDPRKVTGECSTCWDALRVAFPAEAITGSPKIKAMKLIDELEVKKRGVYGGGIGSISFTGDMDIALASRTIVFPTVQGHDTLFCYKSVSKRREWVAHIQAGAAVFADTDPRDVERECESEAAAIARAIDLAESSFL